MPKNLKSSIFVESTFVLPYGEDEEGLSIKYKVFSTDGGLMPSFVKYDE